MLTRWRAVEVGESESLAIEDSLLNQFSNWKGEAGRKAWYVKEAVDVEGVVVEVESLRRWANEYPGLLPYLNAPRVPGWTP